MCSCARPRPRRSAGARLRPHRPGHGSLRGTVPGNARVTLPLGPRGEAAMATGPGDELAATATGYGGLRASDADRERVIGILKAAFVEGRLDRDEFDRRVGKAFVSRTYAELAAHTADLTAKPIAPKPPKAARAQRWRPVLGPGRVLAAATALYAGLSIWVSTTPNGGDNPVAGPWLYAGGIVYMLVLIAIAVDRMAAAREKRSGGQPPRPPSARPGGQRPPGDHGHRRSYGPRPVRVPG